MQTVLLESRTAQFSFTETLGFAHRLTVRRIKPFNVSDIRLVADGIGFFDYRIFPSEILQFCAEWQLENRSMRVGDTVAQCARLPFGLVRGLFAVRIREVRRGPELCSFSYGTLNGHPEIGTSCFELMREENGIAFAIETRSRPACLAQFGVAAALIRAYQRYCTGLALQSVVSQVERLRGLRDESNER